MTKLTLLNPTNDYVFGRIFGYTSWHIREDEFSEIILTEKLELHIIELKKLEVNNNPSVIHIAINSA